MHEIDFDAGVWGLLYTHHRVPDRVLSAMLASVRAMGLPDERLLISCQRPDDRLPERAKKVYFTPSDPFWIPAIYEQMLAGLDRLHDQARVLTLEHDVLYPATYLDVMSDAMTSAYQVYYYTLVRHLDIRAGQRADFWASDPNGTRTLQSCAGGQVGLLKQHARTDLMAYRSGTLHKDFELGVIPGGWARVDADQPVLDLRQGSNTSSTGYDKTIHHETDYHAYWGHAHHLRRRLIG